MLQPFLLSMLCFLAALSSGLCRSWVPLRTKSGDWLAVREVEAGREYWLRPRPELEGVRRCRHCPYPNAWSVKVRFWSEKELTTARACLRDQGFCKTADPCRVAPFQAARIALQDQLGRWELLTPWMEVSGIIPATQEFALRAKIGGPKAAMNGSEGLAFFDVAIVSAMEATSGAAEQPVFAFTGQDLQWALRLLKLGTPKSGTLLSQALLSKLAARIYDIRAPPGRPPALSPSLRIAIERRLTAATAAFRPGLASLLPTGYRAAPSERLFALRQLRPDDRVVVPAAPEGREAPFRMALAAAALTQVGNGAFVANRTAEEFEMEKSAARIRRLEDALEAHRQQLGSVMKALKSSSFSDPKVPLLQRQVALLANAINASHLLQPSTMNLTAIDDCWEARGRGGLFFLRPFRRTVLCSTDGELVLLRRTNGDVNFNASWGSFKIGLGRVEGGDFFLGLDFLANYTSRSDTCMKLLLSPLKSQYSTREAQYDSFQVGPAEDKYRMSYVAFKGTVLKDVLAVMNGQSFTTFDSDNDQFDGNCAAIFASGNWFNACRNSNIFGEYKKGGTSSMCSQAMDASQGDMCTPLASVHMLLKTKKNTQGSRKVVFSTVSSTSCSATLKLYTVPHTALYTFTVGGAPGGRAKEEHPLAGGRGAKVRAEVFLRKGTVIGASAGCPGVSTGYAGDGGDASWVVDRSKGILLVTAGGGGGGGDSKAGTQTPKLPGMHGRASTEGSDGWRNPHYGFKGSVDSILRKVSSVFRGKGWADLRQRLLFESSGSLRSGAAMGGGKDTSNGGGGGGGGFKGGFIDPKPSGASSSGGGGGSFCNATEAASCSLTTGGNGHPVGFVIMERNSCL